MDSSSLTGQFLYAFERPVGDEKFKLVVSWRRICRAGCWECSNSSSTGPRSVPRDEIDCTQIDYVDRLIVCCPFLSVEGARQTFGIGSVHCRRQKPKKKKSQTVVPDRVAFLFSIGFKLSRTTAM